MKDLIPTLRISLVAVISLTTILCIIYPLLVWLCAQILFTAEAGGSFVMQRGRVIGSVLISQGFTDPAYFHPRPSSAGKGYDPAASGGSNLGPLSKKLYESVSRRITDFRRMNGVPEDVPVPADAVTGSASGLDPHISLKNAHLQMPRVAKMRGLKIETVFDAIERNTEDRDLGFIGEPRVNVLMLNLELDKILK